MGFSVENGSHKFYVNNEIYTANVYTHSECVCVTVFWREKKKEKKWKILQGDSKVTSIIELDRKLFQMYKSVYATHWAEYKGRRRIIRRKKILCWKCEVTDNFISMSICGCCIIMLETNSFIWRLITCIWVSEWERHSLLTTILFSFLYLWMSEGCLYFNSMFPHHFFIALYLCIENWYENMLTSCEWFSSSVQCPNFFLLSFIRSDVEFFSIFLTV